MTAPAGGVDGRVAPFLGRVLDGAGDPVGTCFQLTPGVLATAWHVLDGFGAGDRDAVVQIDPLPGGEPRDAVVVAIDPVHDLAVLTTGVPLAGCVAGVAATDELRPRDEVTVTGVVAVDDVHTYRHLDATGEWAGGTTRDETVPLGRLTASAVLPGMSGAPVLTTATAFGTGGVVVGVVSARYNSADGWLRDSVWVARTENLAPLLAGVTDVRVATRPQSGPIDVVLAIDDTTVRLTGAGLDVTAAHGGVSPGLADAVRGLRRARSSMAGARGSDTAVASGVAATPTQVGALMARLFLPGPVAAALGSVVGQARARWAPLRIGIAVEGPLRGLPWEALALPGGGPDGGPVALHPLSVVYRRYPGATVAQVGEPLRIVVAISSPLSGGGGVLDYERELRNILLAVRGARQSRARVRVVHFATTAEIRQVMVQERAHVLHLSGHGRPGRLEFEDDHGGARPLDAAEFVAEAIPAGRMPPVIVLAACHTDVATATGDPSFAASLIAHGAGVVIGTETSVTDVYATRMFARIYEALVDAERPDVVGALAQARRIVQRELASSPDVGEQALAGLQEWAVVTVLAGSGSVTLFDPTQPGAIPPGATRPAPAAPRRVVVPAGLLSRDVGEFVGRRRAQRQWPVALLGSGAAGLVVHGIGGIGKTTLAAELLRRVGELEPERIMVVGASGLTGGQVTVDDILAALGRQLRFHLRGTAGPDAVRVCELVQRPDLDWQQRWELLRDHVLAEWPVVLVLDNFEDNLAPANPGSDPEPGGGGREDGRRTVRDAALAQLLTGLATTPGQARLLITTRYPFTLPDGAHRGLVEHHLGPLSPAETMKLAWALPQLDLLAPGELARVCRMVGGHPRCLEYLDALLAGGRGVYPDVTARLATAVARRLDTDDLGGWFAAHTALDPALTDVVTLAADDVLLGDLLRRLDTVPGAVDLLRAASVFRTPVPVVALLFHLGRPDPTAARTPDRGAANEQIVAILQGVGVAVDDSLDLSALPTALQQQIAPHLAELQQFPTPPLRAPDDLARVIEVCATASLLSVERTDDGQVQVFVHRWTATELHRRWTSTDDTGQVTAAHQHAADYWQWRVAVWPQNRAQDLEDQLEARHHLLEAHQPDQAGAITEDVCTRLHALGAWDREEVLIHDTLTRLPTGAARRGVWLGRLGTIAGARGQIARATELFQQARALYEGLLARDPNNTEFQRDLSVSYDSLAGLASAAGETGEAARLYQQGLTIAEGLVARDPNNTQFQRDLSISYNSLAGLASAAGETEVATSQISAAIEIRSSLHRREPGRVDLAEELAVTLRQQISITGQTEPARSDALRILEPFEQQQRLTADKGEAVLAWFRSLEP